MKIKDTKIASKLPRWVEMFDKSILSTEQILNTELDPNEICEVDVEEMAFIAVASIEGHIISLDGEQQAECERAIAQAIAKAGCIKFKEKP